VPRRTPPRTGTPRLLRAINDQAALELLLERGPMTRTQIGEATGLSKPTVSQLVERLDERGLVTVVGQQAGGRGPNAMLYSVVASAAYVVGVDVSASTTTAAVADLTGTVVGRASAKTDGAEDPVRLVRGAVSSALADSGVSIDQVHEAVVGTPGLIDPRTADISFAWDLPTWHAGVLPALRDGLGLPVTLENDVNLAAVAEQELGVTRDVDDFVLLWADRGLGMAVVLGGRLHRGVSGGAGEIGYLPVPGESPIPTRGDQAGKGSFQLLVGADAVRALGRQHGFRHGDAIEIVESAAESGGKGAEFLDDLATRLAVGVAGVCAVVDPAVVVLAGGIGKAGGQALADNIQAKVEVMSPLRPKVAVTGVTSEPTLHGAIRLALRTTREAVFGAASPATESVVGAG
jgi:predicted NBD/HSP70 family sugar kinase